MKNPSSPSNKRIGDRLMAEGKLTPEAYASALQYLALHGGRIEEAILESGLMAEADLLRAIATIHGTRFVSTEKLYKANIDQRILELIPRKLADQHQVFPVMYDDVGRVLSIVTADPDNLSALHEVKIASSVREVTALVARPASVHAAIQRAYYNDASGFATLLSPAKIQLSVDRFSTGSQTGPNPFGISQTGPNPFAATPVTSPAAGIVRPLMSLETRTDSSPSTPAVVLEGDDVIERISSRPPRPGPGAARKPPPPPAQRKVTVPEAPAPVTLTSDYVESLNVLITLLENARSDLRGHSSSCARLTKRVCDRIGASPAQTAAFVVAAYLHDLGKAGTYHLTALNVAEYDGHKIAAQKVFNVPERFLQTVQLVPETKSAINAMYERFDGKGFPGGVAGKSIPLGARVLAVVDTYADLTQNPRNPARRMLKPAEAVAFMTKKAGAVFDPAILDVLRAEVAGEDLRARLLADRYTVLLADPDPEETTVLELKLLEAGFDVRIARTMQQAVHELQTREVAIVVSEVDLDGPDAGLSLRGQASNEPWGSAVLVWIVHTRKTDRQLAEIVFELGVDDLVSKPTPPDVFVTKLRQLVERKRARTAPAAPRGVNGSLAEMSLPDMVQILFHGRKTCTVRLKTPRGAGDIGFVEGQIIDARLGPARGEDAFYKMLALKEGDFQIDPETVPRDRTIETSPEGLLLEGMRRLDEGLV